MSLAKRACAGSLGSDMCAFRPFGKELIYEMNRVGSKSR